MPKIHYYSVDDSWNWGFWVLPRRCFQEGFGQRAFRNRRISRYSYGYWLPKPFSWAMIWAIPKKIGQMWSAGRISLWQRAKIYFLLFYAICHTQATHAALLRGRGGDRRFSSPRPPRAAVPGQLRCVFTVFISFAFFCIYLILPIYELISKAIVRCGSKFY